MTTAAPVRRFLCGPALLGLLALGAPSPVGAAETVRPAVPALPYAAARDAADAAVAKCAAAGHPVVAAVLDPGSQFQIVARRDGAAPYAIESARLKAYTILNPGPIRNAPNTDALVKQILLEPGGVAIMRPDCAITGTIGVAGSPAGKLDEDCAQAGADVATARLAGAKPWRPDPEARELKDGQRPRGGAWAWRQSS